MVNNSLCLTKYSKKCTDKENDKKKYWDFKQCKNKINSLMTKIVILTLDEILTKFVYA